MFLRKILSSENKLTWVVIDLVIVIIGVYCAFLIQSYAEEQKSQRMKEQVLTALKFELEAFRIQLPEFADYVRDYLKDIQAEENPDISGWRFVEPQYSYKIVEYAMQLENGDIIDFEMYDNLQKLYVSIKQLEHVERLITNRGGAYKRLVPELPKDHPVNLERMADNQDNLRRFTIFLRGRIGNLMRVTNVSSDVLKRIDADLGYEKSKEIERAFIIENMPRIGSEEEVIALGAAYFPKFNEDEIIQLFLDSKK